MRVMVIVKATKESEAENNPFDVEGAAEMFEAMGKYNEQLVKAGIMLAADGLKPSKFGKRVHFDGAKRSVTDGPFAETKEVLGGFNLIEARDMDEAVEIAKQFPWSASGCIEVRPVRDIEGVRQRVGADVAAD